MLSIQTEQYFPLYKFTWEKFQSTNEGPEQEREPKYQEVGLGENWRKKKIQALRTKGQEGDDIHLTENKCLFLWIEK